MKNEEFSILNSQLSITEISAHLSHQWGIFFSPTDFHRFARIWFLGSLPALGIGAASFASGIREVGTGH